MRRLYRNTVLFSSVGIGSVITLYLRNKSLNGTSNDQEAHCRPRSAIIIGGGIIGISSALQLAKRGVNVTVIEEQPGEVSSSPLDFILPSGNIFPQMFLWLPRIAMEPLSATPWRPAGLART